MDILFFAAIAVFVFFKLWEQLGKVDDDQKRQSIKKFVKENANVVEAGPPKEAKFIDENSKNKDQEIPSLDKESLEILSSLANEPKAVFSDICHKFKIYPSHFTFGARSAFEAIVKAFSDGDIKILKPLLSGKIIANFSAAIDDKKQKKQHLNSKIVAIKSTKIQSAKMDSALANIVVEFTSEQINYIVDEEDGLISGSKTQIDTVKDVWTFEKKLSSKDPNWLLVATG